MAFDLNITLTGLVVFVPNACANSRAKMVALLVDGRQEDRKALDRQFLRFHKGFVKFPIENISPTNGVEESFGLWYLNRERLFIEVEHLNDDAAVANLFNITQPSLGDPHPETPDQSNRHSFSWVLNLEKASPDFLIEPELLGSSPPKESVLAQVVIDQGTLQTKETTPVVWTYETTLSGKIYNQVFAHEVELLFKDLKSARIRAVSFDSPDKNKYLDLGALQKDGRVKIDIINACERNPLDWDITQRIEADEDTKWYFELLKKASKEKVVDDLRKAHLPVPRPLRPVDKGGAPGSGNCIPSKVQAPVPFSIKDLDGENFECKLGKGEEGVGHGHSFK